MSPKDAAEDDQMSVSTPDLSDTRAEVDSPSRLAATSVALRPAPGHIDDAASGVPAAGVQAASRSPFLRGTAAKVQAAAKEGTRADGREHLRGHLIELLDVSTYDPKSRYIKGKFAGGVRVISLLVSLAMADEH